MAKKFDMSKYIEEHTTAVPQVQYKEATYIDMPIAWQKATGLPGYPRGLMTFQYGLSDSGKTALLLSAVANAQKAGDLVFLILTENKTDRKRLTAAGVDLENNIVIVEHLKHLEDVYDFISMKVHEMKSGALPVNVFFAWDSLAGSPSKESMSFEKDGKIKKNFTNQKNANVIGFYNPIIAKLISETRETTCEGTATLLMITQAYVKHGEFPGAPSTIVPNGGEKIYFPASLTLEVKEGRRLKAAHKGKDIEYGLVSKIKVKKNHITELNCEGEILLLGTELLENDKKEIDNYKEKNRERWAELLDQAAATFKKEEEE